MFENKETAYGYEMTFSGFIDHDEMESWADDARELLQDAGEDFGVLVDMRDLDAMAEDAQELMTDVKSDYHDNGMTRQSNIVDSPTAAMQFEQMAEGTGGEEGDRYFNTKTDDNVEEDALKWVRDGIDTE